MRICFLYIFQSTNRTNFCYPVIRGSHIILKKIYGHPEEDKPQRLCKRQNYSRIVDYSGIAILKKILRASSCSCAQRATDRSYGFVRLWWTEALYACECVTSARAMDYRSAPSAPLRRSGAIEIVLLLLRYMAILKKTNLFPDSGLFQDCNP
jgi:hypothetical protein